MVIVGLGLRQSCFCGAELSLGIEGGAAGFASGLTLGFNRLTNLGLLAFGGGSGGLLSCLKVLALNDGDQLAGLN